MLGDRLGSGSVPNSLRGDIRLGALCWFSICLVSSEIRCCSDYSSSNDAVGPDIILSLRGIVCYDNYLSWDSFFNRFIVCFAGLFELLRNGGDFYCFAFSITSN